MLPDSYLDVPNKDYGGYYFPFSVYLKQSSISLTFFPCILFWNSLNNHDINLYIIMILISEIMLTDKNIGR